MTAPLTPEQAVAELASLRFEDVFNPYSDRCPEHDLEIAPQIRRANLLATFVAGAAGVDEVWIALEPGHRGARRTGIAMTDEDHLAEHAERWGLAGIRRATKSGPGSEQTAGIVWEALSRSRKRVMLWNIFPLHCHRSDEPLSNRRHTRVELEACSQLTQGILQMLEPTVVVAIGAEAHDAVSRMVPGCVQVRHPARGGKNAFLAGVAR